MMRKIVTFNCTLVPSSSIERIGTPPSLFSIEFCGRKRQTTLILFPDIFLKRLKKSKEKQRRIKKRGKKGLAANTVLKRGRKGV
jgi:hypothetical protein